MCLNTAGDINENKDRSDDRKQEYTDSEFDIHITDIGHYLI